MSIFYVSWFPTAKFGGDGYPSHSFGRANLSVLRWFFSRFAIDRIIMAVNPLERKPPITVDEHLGHSSSKSPFR